MSSEVISVVLAVTAIMSILPAVTGHGVKILGYSVGGDYRMSTRQRLALGTIGVTLCGLLIYRHFDPNPGGPPKVEQAEKTFDLAPRQIDEQSDPQCQPKPRANVVLGGSPLRIGNVLQCEHTRVSDGWDLQYAFRLPDELDAMHVKALTGTFGIDEAGDVDQHGAIATWSIEYQKRPVCEVRAKWKEPANFCRPSLPMVINGDDPLVVKQRLYTRNPRERRRVFVAIYSLRIVMAPANR